MPRLLVVDDDRLIADGTAEFFRARDWDVMTAYDIHGAVEAIKTTLDAVLLDLKLPERAGDPPLDDGGEIVFAKIKNSPRLKSTCVIVLTAYGSIESAVRCLRAGVQHYIEKTVDIENLWRLLVSGIAKQKADVLRAEILGSVEVGAKLGKISEILSETLAPDGAHLILLDSAGAIRTVERGSKPLSEHEISSLRGGKPRCFVERIRSSGQPVVSLDPDRIASLDPILENCKSLLAVPIFNADGGVSGVIDLESAEEGAFDVGWEAVVSHFADLVAFALDISAKTQAKLDAELATDRVNMSKELLAQQGAVQQMTLAVRELGHRILTPVHVISMQAETMLAKELRVGAPRAGSNRSLALARRRARVIMDKASEIDSVCVYLRDISRDVPVQCRKVKVWSLIQETAGAHLAQFEREQIAVTLPGRDTRNIVVQADASLLKYSFECLLQNALEAIEEARLAATRRSTGAAKKRVRKGDAVTISIEVDALRSRVLVKVADTGTGVPQEYRDRLFVALFTTKTKKVKQSSSGRGTGLFSVSRYMRLQGGSIELADTPPPGATFALGIPMGDAELERNGM